MKFNMSLTSIKSFMSNVLNRNRTKQDPLFVVPLEHLMITKSTENSEEQIIIFNMYIVTWLLSLLILFNPILACV